jgi:SAM-dependent methyltransferase
MQRLVPAFCRFSIRSYHRQKTISMSASETEKAHPRWAELWDAGLKVGDAFDAGTPCPALLNEIAHGRIPEGRALVPGCGRGYDVYALASPTRVAVGLELSDKAIEEARAFNHQPCRTPENALFRKADFFKLPTGDNDKYDFIYDYTFLCALHPTVHQEWAKQMARLVKPGGILLTLVFPICDKPYGVGPPFAVNMKMVEDLLMGTGTASDDHSSTDGSERISVNSGPKWVKEQLELLPKELCHPGRDGTENGFRQAGQLARGKAMSGIGRWRRLDN